MDDGHSGIKNRQVNQGGSGNFQLILAYLQQGTGRGDFVIHATSNISYSAGLQPLQFLASIGFNHYEGECLFHHDKCFYRVVATLQQDIYGFENDDHTQKVHHAFRAFAGKISELFQLRQNEARILREIGIEPLGRIVLGPTVILEIDETSVPLWANEVKFPKLLELEAQSATLQKEIDDLSAYLPLLYTTGDMLEKAVIKALRWLGLDAEQTSEGFTVDILAQTPDGLRRFGFEVTGISGPIKKDSKKLTQVLDFERIKEHGEKTILVANTYNTTPISAREKLEDFTPQVIDFLGRHPILLMTSWDLYRMIADTLQGSRSKNEITDLLYMATGRLRY